MNFLVQRLARLETTADKEEFVRGVAGLEKDAGKKKFLTGIIAGYLISTRRTK
jgi:hypothetical protein